MIQAQLASPWAGDGQTIATAYRPKIHDDYPLVSYVQVRAGNPPAPVLVEIICAEETWSAITANPVYAGAVVRSAPS